MELIITKNTQIRTIQKEFQKHYPLLKIEFYKKPHKAHEGSAAKNLISPDAVISKQSQRFKEGTLHIRGNMTVNELENHFNEFDLYVQVFRKSGDAWLQTINTDNWTLIQQTESAAEMEKKDAIPAPEDYHEQE